MEHRWGNRVPARLQFDVVFQERPLGRCWTRNVSEGGLFLETGATAIGRNSFLELRFQVGRREHRLCGLVVHRLEGEGVGVQLAVWRAEDRVAYSGFLEISSLHRRFAERMVG